MVLPMDLATTFNLFKMFAQQTFHSFGISGRCYYLLQRAAIVAFRYDDGINQCAVGVVDVIVIE